METQLNRWKLQRLWNTYAQGIDVQDLQEEILFYLEQDQQDEFWLVVEDQNEPLLIGLTDFEYGMHLRGIPKPYKERFLMWMYTYAQKNPQSMIHAICKSGMWDADVLKICHNGSISSILEILLQSAFLHKKYSVLQGHLPKATKRLFHIPRFQKYLYESIWLQNLNCICFLHNQTIPMHLQNRYCLHRTDLPFQVICNYAISCPVKTIWNLFILLNLIPSKPKFLRMDIVFQPKQNGFIWPNVRQNLIILEVKLSITSDGIKIIHKVKSILLVKKNRTNGAFLI